MGGGDKAIISLEAGGRVIEPEGDWDRIAVPLFPCFPHPGKNGDGTPAGLHRSPAQEPDLSAWVCPQVLGFLSALCQFSVRKPEWVVNHGEERKVGLDVCIYLVFVFTQSRNSLGTPATSQTQC